MGRFIGIAGAGSRAFFNHTEPAMRKMADLLKRGRYADEIMKAGEKEESITKA